MFSHFLQKKCLPLVLLAVMILMAARPAAAEFTPDNAAKPDPLNSQKQTQGMSVGEFTGAAIYQVPLSMPSGRNGLTPNVSLTYNSQDEALDNLVGYHWSLTHFSIKRVNKQGVEKLYERHDFTADTPFASRELVEVTLTDGQHGHYAERFESSFADYQYLDDGSWQVIDTSGNRYFFGMTEEGIKFDPADPTRVAEWALQEIRDTNDNFIRFSYQKIGNQLYPDEIRYTGHGSEEGIFKIKFLRSESRRPDTHFSYATGFRVDTEYLIIGVEIYSQDVLRHRYDFNHISVPPLVRQTIGSIEETGYSSDGTLTALPPANFEYTPSDIRFEETTDYFPDWFFEDCHGGAGTCNTPNVYMWDMTGDGLMDFEYSTSGIFTRAINNGKGGWTKVPATFLTSFYSSVIPGVDRKPLDFNGDLATDIVSSSKNNINGNIDSSHNLEVALLSGQMPGKLDNGAAVADLNGDNLPDILQKRSLFTGKGGNVTDQSTCLNEQGSACVLSNLWPSPETIITDTDFYQYPRDVYVQDCNMDGLADVRFAGSGPRNWINDGKGGWILNPPGVCQFSQLDSLARRSEDFNGDGLIDSVTAERTILPVGQMITNEIHVSTGDGQVPMTLKNEFPVVLGTFGNSFNNDDGVRLLDLNGDKLPDIMQSKTYYDGKGNTTVTRKVFMNKGSRPYFLKTVHTATGARMDLEYKTSAQYFKADGSKANGNLPILVDTVSKMTIDDGTGHVSETTYFYEDGHYYFDSPADRIFAGFRVVTKTDGLGFVSKNYYHQSQNSVTDSAKGEYDDDISKKGMAYRAEIYDQQAQLMVATIRRFDKKDLGVSHAYPFLSQSLVQSFDGGQTKSVAQSFVYDDFGNPTELIDYGEVSGNNDGSFSDSGADLIKSISSFVNGTAYSYQAEMLDQTGSRLRQSRIYYDQLPLGQVQLGNATASEVWLDASNSWIRSETEYDDYGLPISNKNPRGFSTETTYDGYHLYPVTVTNAKGHVVSMSYDVATGQPLASTDPNDVTTTSTYDGVGRPLTTSVNGNLMAQNMYDDAAFPRSFRAIAYNDDGESVESTSYFDGLGRVMESKQEMPGGNWTTVQTIYDERGKVSKSIQPYFSGSSVFEPLDAGKLGTSYTYDALGRPLTITNSMGTTMQTYGSWQLTGTDPLGNSKTLVSDSRGRLIRVDEKNDGQAHSTHYAYDSLGNLMQMKDAQNNVRTFAYDSLGRRLFQSQLGSVSAWNYTYDANGNLIQKNDPKGQVLIQTFDELDRLLMQDKLAFIYDSGSYGLGRLSKVQKSGYEHSFAYDFLGRVIFDSRIIGDKTFDFSYAYDQLGSLTALTYPDATMATYEYDGAHQLEAVKMGESVFANDFSYNPVGQATQMTLGNGTLIQNTFDPMQMYRLTAKTASGGVAKYSYSYDAVGNLTNLVDEGMGITAKNIRYEYDDLYRLTKADYDQTANQNDLTERYQYDAIGNMIYKSDLGNYTYAGTHPQAVTSVGDHVYDYDANGNMILRDGQVMSYDLLDRLVQSDNVNYTYGEGYDRLTKADETTGKTTYYPSQYFELHPDKEVKYIYAGSQRIAKIEKSLKTEEENSEDDEPDSDSDETEDEKKGDDEEKIDDQEEGSDDNSDAGEAKKTVIPVAVASEEGTGQSGKYRSQDQLKLMRFIAESKKDEAKKLAKKIYLYTLNALELSKNASLAVGMLPESAFPNLRISYTKNSATLSWDAMPKNVAGFRIYRSKGRQATATEEASVYIGELAASHFGHTFVDRFEKPGSKHAYRIEAVDKKGKHLVWSMKLHSRQVFLNGNESKSVDPGPFTKATFTHARLKGNEFIATRSGSTPQMLVMSATASLKNGRRMPVSFLTCSANKDGSLVCKKTDEQWIEVYRLDPEGRPL